MLVEIIRFRFRTYIVTTKNIISRETFGFSVSIDKDYSL